MAKTNNLVLMGACVDPPCEQADCSNPGDPPTTCAELATCLMARMLLFKVELTDDGDCQWSKGNGVYEMQLGCDEICGEGCLPPAPDSCGGYQWLRTRADISTIFSDIAFACTGVATGIDTFAVGFCCNLETDEVLFYSSSRHILGCSAPGPGCVCDFSYPFGMYSDVYTFAEVVALLMGEAAFDIPLPYVSAIDGAPAGSTGVLTFIGTPGCVSCSTDAPTAGATVTNAVPVGTFCGPGPDTGSCLVNIESDSTPGDAECPVERVWILHDQGGFEIPADGTSEPHSLFDDCGPFAGTDLDLRVLAVDECGCTDESAIDFSCCNCCNPSGSVGIEFDDVILEGDEGELSGCANSSGPDAADECGVLVTFRCYYKFTFSEIESTDCSPVTEPPHPTCWEVEWDGMEDRFGTPLVDGPVAPGEVRARHNSGAGGTQHCVRFRPRDDRGCDGEWTEAPFPNLYSRPPGYEPNDPPTCADGHVITLDCEGFDA